jgi:hypothetical protein
MERGQVPEREMRGDNKNLEEGMKNPRENFDFLKENLKSRMFPIHARLMHLHGTFTHILKFLLIRFMIAKIAKLLCTDTVFTYPSGFPKHQPVIETIPKDCACAGLDRQASHE